MDNKGERVILHLSAFIVPFIGPLFIYFLSQDPFTKKVSLQAMIYNFVLGICLGISWIFTFLIIGIPFFLFFGAVYFIVPILGIVRTLNDELYQYPVIKHFI